MHKTSFIWMFIKWVGLGFQNTTQIVFKFPAKSALSKLVFINCLFYKQKCADHCVWKLKTPNLLIQ